MKLLIASDIHGSAYWCERLLERFESSDAEQLVLLGDLLYHGPRNELPKGYDPKAVTEMLNGIAEKLLCVRGNCDAEVDQMVLHFPITADYAFLALDGVRIFATHGHLFSPEEPPKLFTGDILLCGHTHVPADRAVGHFRYLNPGSISLPKEGSGHSYLVFDGGNFSFESLEEKSL